MKEITGSGIRMRLVDKWDILPDPTPLAMSLAQCPHCGARAGGTGSTLKESDDRAIAELAKHQCIVFAGTLSG